MTKFLLSTIFVGLYLIGSAQCPASFTYTINNGTVSFSNTSTGGSLFNSWDFGDGNTSFQSNPNHTYTVSNNYMVCLTIFDSLTQCQSTYCDTFYVAADTTGVGCTPVSNAYADGMGNIYGTASGGTYYDWGVFDANWNQLYTTTGGSLNYAPGANGHYNVCVTTYDSQWSACDSTCYTVNVIDSIGGSGGCNTVSSVINDWNGNIVGFASGATYYDWAVYDVNWTFLYGSNGTNLNYAPGYDGQFNVCLVTYDSLWSVCDSTCYNIGVINSGGNGCNVTAGVTMDSMDNIVGTASGAAMYHWIVFDDSWNYLYDTNNPNFTYTPPSPGEYYLCLTSYDSLQMVCDSTCFSVFSNSIASISEEDEIIVFDVYPNPTQGIIHLELSNDAISEVVLVDMTGAVILQKTINEATTEINLGDFPKGMYFIHALGRKGQRISSQKVLRQ